MLLLFFYETITAFLHLYVPNISWQRVSKHLGLNEKLHGLSLLSPFKNLNIKILLMKKKNAKNVEKENTRKKNKIR